MYSLGFLRTKEGLWGDDGTWLDEEGGEEEGEEFWFSLFEGESESWGKGTLRTGLPVGLLLPFGGVLGPFPLGGLPVLLEREGLLMGLECPC